MLKKDVCVATEEEELCPESIKERCSGKKTRKKLGMLVNGWNHIARKPVKRIPEETSISYLTNKHKQNTERKPDS